MFDEEGIIQGFSSGDASGAVSFSSPGPDFDLSGFLDRATSTFSTVAKTVGELQLARERIASTNEQNAFNRWMQTQSLDLQRAQITNAGNIERIKAAAELQRAAGAANNSGVLGTIFPSASGDYSGLIAIAAVVGVVIAVMQYRKR